MTQNINAIIFDLGNVLIGWDPRQLYKRLLPDLETVDRFLEQIRFPEWNAKQDAGRPFREGVAELSKEFPQYAELIQAYDTYWEESLTGTHDGTIELVKELRQAGWKLFMLSNFSVEKFEIIKQHYGFLDFFDDIVISGEYNVVKPDPAIFEIAIERFGRPANKYLFIDDSAPNITTAQRLGFNTIHYQSPTQLREQLKKLSIKGIK